MMNKPQPILANNISQTTSYYADGIDDYYSVDGAGAWYGQGADELKLSGDVDEGRFRELLLGHIADNEHVSRIQANGEAGIAAYDLTFSPPKSVTIQALVAKDGNVIGVHDMAVRTALDAIEKHLIARKTEQGVTSYERSGKAVFAAFRHETNREQEPQLHSHAILINATQRKDGAWRAFDNNELYKLRGEFSRIYDVELAKGLSELGYDIRYERDSFELNHISREQIEAFSNRTMQINDALEERGLTRETASAEVKQVVTLQTRKAKEKVDRAELQQKWEFLADELNIDLIRSAPELRDVITTKKIIRNLEKNGEKAINKAALIQELGKAFPEQNEAALERKILQAETAGVIRTVHGSSEQKGAVFEIPKTIDKSLEADAALKFTLAHLGERKAAIGHEKIVEVAVRHSINQSLTREDVEQAILRQISSGKMVRDEATYVPAENRMHELARTRAHLIGRLVHNGYASNEAEKIVEADIHQGRYKKAEHSYTTRDAIEKELAILHYAEVGKMAVQPVMNAETADLIMTKKAATMGQTQKDAAIKILSTPDRVIGVQGYAGTGKSFMLQTVIEAAHEQGYTVKAIAPYTSQVKSLRELGIEAETLEGFIRRQETEIDNKTIVVLDESGVASTRQMEIFLKQIEENGSRVVLVGDIAQTKAIEAGKPFNDLQKTSTDFAVMDEIRRQKQAIDREAIMMAATGDLGGAVSKLRDIQEIGDDLKRYQRIAADYKKAINAEQTTLVVTGTNDSRRAINESIRNELGLADSKQQGALKILSREDTTRAQRKHAQYYKVGDVVQIEVPDTEAGLAHSDRYEVLRLNNSQNQLTLKPLEGNINTQTMVIDALKLPNISVYKPDVIAVAPGDQIRITRNNAELDLANGDIGQVTQINQKSITLNIDGREVVLDKSKHLHIDYAYCTTAHAAQGMTVDKTIVNVDVKSQTTVKPTFYVAISRHKSDLTVYVNDRAKMVKAVSRNDKKRSALEVTANNPAPVEKKKTASIQVFETENAPNYKQQIVTTVCAAPEKKQPKIIVASDLAKADYDALMRLALGFTGKGKMVELHQEKPMRAVESKDIQSYSKGDIVSFARNFPKMGLIKSVPYTVAKIDQGKNAIYLTSPTGEQARVNPLYIREAKKHDIHQREVSQQERLRATQDMPDIGLKKGDEFRVKSVSGTLLALETVAGDIVCDSKRHPLRAEYAYSVNVQSMPTRRIAQDMIVDMDKKDDMRFNKLVMLADGQVNVCVPRMADLPVNRAADYTKVEWFDIQAQEHQVEMKKDKTRTIERQMGE